MQVDTEFLKKHYASLSDEAFEEIDRSGLTSAAQKIYDEEKAQRGVLGEEVPEEIPYKVSDEVEPDWIKEAICVRSYRTWNGQYNTEEADKVRKALQAAGIPVHTGAYAEPPAAATTHFVELMIPGNRSLQAENVLDLEIENPEMEEIWRTHLATLTDREFKDLNFDSLIVGLTDRIERLRRVYKEELSARRRPE